MKTILEWFDMLPVDIRAKAFRNIILQNIIHDKQVHSIIAAFTNAFTWEDTPEGYRYWNNVLDDLVYRKFINTQWYILH